MGGVVAVPNQQGVSLLSVSMLNPLHAGLASQAVAYEPTEAPVVPSQLEPFQSEFRGTGEAGLEPQMYPAGGEAKSETGLPMSACQGRRHR